MNFSIEVYDSIDELNQEDVFLLSEARSATQFAYAPYSNFNVGAAARLINGEVVTGSNQENASYPAGICAERSLLSTAAALHPGIAMDTLAVTYHNLKGTSDTPISPCGICRQTIMEFQNRFKSPIKIILSGLEGKVQVISNASHLLPLAFTSDDLK